MENLNKRSKFSPDFDRDDPFNFENKDSEPTGRPIIGSDSSDEDVISDLEDSDEGFGFINEGNLSKRINALCHHYLISMQPYLTPVVSFAPSMAQWPLIAI